jgi:hypothetical protein
VTIAILRPQVVMNGRIKIIPNHEIKRIIFNFALLATEYLTSKIDAGRGTFTRQKQLM